MANKDSDLRSYGLRLEAQGEDYLVFAPVEEYRNHQVMPQRIFVEKVHERRKRMILHLMNITTWKLSTEQR